MEFSRKKLPSDNADKMRICPIRTLAPYAPLIAPAYVFMKRNEKFVAVKAPLDFFTPEELERIKPFESVFFPEFVDASLLFRESGRSARAILAWIEAPDGVSKAEVPAPYEVSDAMLRIVGQLWSGELTIEPFFVAVFVNELCGLLPSKELCLKRDLDVAAFERDLLVSAWTVFLALHLGYTDLAYLVELRRKLFLGAPVQPITADLRELIELAPRLWNGSTVERIACSALGKRHERVAQRIAGRLERVQLEFASEGKQGPSIFGAGGFVDV